MTDSLLRQAGAPVFSWGQQVDLAAAGDVRGIYLDALRTADAGDITRLSAFVRR